MVGMGAVGKLGVVRVQASTRTPAHLKGKAETAGEYESSAEKSGHFYLLRGVGIVLTFCFRPVSPTPSFQLPRDKESSLPARTHPPPLHAFCPHKCRTHFHFPPITHVLSFKAMNTRDSLQINYFPLFFFCLHP